ncbi:MAG: hypothetical protein WB422_01305, partial [Pseudolabrys sp.]
VPCRPKVKIYAPKEGFGIFGSSLQSSFYRKAEALPPDMRYFDGCRSCNKNHIESRAIFNLAGSR